jgi:Nickel responsive protein SCO4226-like
MDSFLVELYVSRTDLAAFERDAESARRAAERLSRQGTPVRYLHSLFVPDDETCFHLYEAASAESVRKATDGAGLLFARISEAVPGSGSPTGEKSKPICGRKGARHG